MYMPTLVIEIHLTYKTILFFYTIQRLFTSKGNVSFVTFPKYCVKIIT